MFVPFGTNGIAGGRDKERMSQLLQQRQLLYRPCTYLTRPTSAKNKNNNNCCYHSYSQQARNGTNKRTTEEREETHATNMENMMHENHK